ncbi:MAG: AsmA protein [Dinoroseobacter sp.]|jgi:AsmA protein
MRWIFRLLGVIVAVIMLAVAALFIIPSERIARIVTDQFTAATGRVLTISGDVSPTIYPVLGVRAGGISLANADWSNAGPMLTADELSVGVQLIPLLSGNIEIEEVVITAPRVLLERRADGRANWEFQTASAPTAASATDTTQTPAASSGGLPRISLARGVLSRASIQFNDAVSGQSVSVTGLDLNVALDGGSGQAQLSGDAVVNGQALSFDANSGDLNRLIAGQVEAIALAANVGGVEVSFDGRAGLTPLTLDGAVQLQAPRLDPVFNLIGQPAPSLPGNLGRDLAFAGNVTLTPEGAGRVFVRGATATLGGNALGLEADLALGTPLNLTARITGGALDFSSLISGGTAPPSGSTAPAVTSSGWPRTNIDVSGMAAANANIALTAQSLNLGIVRLGALDIATVLDRSRLVTTLRQVSAYEGAITGELVVNGRGGLSLGGNIRANGVAMQPLLQDLADQDRLIGTANVGLQYLAVGNSMDALMRSLSGNASVNIGQGEVLGLDLAGMLRNFDASFRGEGSKTVFDAITATASIANGVASNSDLLFNAPLVNASGQGTVDIGAQTMNYRFTPVAQTGGAGIAIPVIIEGPWSDLSFRPDLEALVNQNLAAEREALERQVREQAEEALQRELGVNVGAADGNVEQAVRDRVDQQADELRGQVEDQLREGLGRLLGGNN